MIKVYGTWLCPFCRAAEQKLIAAEVEFEFIDIFSTTTAMKEFLQIRDKHIVFEDVKTKGGIGIPTFKKADGTISLKLEDIIND